MKQTQRITSRVAAFAAILFTVTAQSDAGTLTAVYDFEGNANDGVGTNNLTLNAGSSLATVDGRAALAITTDPGNASVATPDGNLSIPTSGGDSGMFSIATWIRYDSSNEGFARAIARSYSGGDGYNLAFEDGNQATSTLNFRINFGGTFYNAPGSLAISRDTWHHVAFSFDNGSVTAWIDGVSESITTNTAGSVQGGEAFVLGTGTSATSGFFGALDEVSFFHGTLSQSEVNALIVPEPSSAVLLVLGGLALLRRRRA